MIKARHIMWALLASGALAVTMLVACGTNSPPQPPLVPCATWQAPDGTWMEPDNDPVDDDPCDLEAGLDGPIFKPTPRKSPVKSSPAPKSTPIGGRKKRF